MSRSLHTQKLENRARRRLRFPRASRREDAARLQGRPTTTHEPIAAKLPICVSKPCPGTFHPLRPRDIRGLLEQAGGASAYGLNRIRMRYECAFLSDAVLFGEYLLAGEIHLYAVPPSPWRIPFVPAEEDIAAFRRHGARVLVSEARQMTTVEWSEEGLRGFYLYEVLAHELGHHLLHYHRGKRLAVTCRRSDHERRAELTRRRTMRSAGEDT